MTRKNNYSFKKETIRDYSFPPQRELERIIKKLSDPKYKGGNLALPANADATEKMKYSFCQSILAYHQESKKTLTAMAKEIGIPGLTEKELYDICRGKITDFCLGELVIYASNLRISSVPCLDCGGNLFPKLLESVILSLKEQASLPTKPNIYQTCARHQELIHC